MDVLKPAIGSEDIGFSTHVGEFDSLVDTLSNEMRSNRNVDYDDDDTSTGGSTLGLLKTEHNCHRYVRHLSSYSAPLFCNNGLTD